MIIQIFSMLWLLNLVQLSNNLIWDFHDVFLFDKDLVKFHHSNDWIWIFWCKHTSLMVNADYVKNVNRIGYKYSGWFVDDEISLFQLIIMFHLLILRSNNSFLRQMAGWNEFVFKERSEQKSDFHLNDSLLITTSVGLYG